MRIDGLTSLAGMPTPPSDSGNKAVSFEDLLRDSIQEVNRLQLDSEIMLERVAAGEDIHPGIVANAVNKADLAMRTMIQIRNKLTQAFQELRQLQF